MLIVLATSAVIRKVSTAVTLPVIWVAGGMLKVLLSAAARASLSTIPPRLAPWRGMPTAAAAAVSMDAAAGPSVAPVAGAPGSFPS